MDITPEVVDGALEEYPNRQPLSAVEAEHLETLPDVLASGEFGWRDAEWVVQWYYRRFLGGYPDEDRRAAEDAYGENTYEAVRTALDGASEASETSERLRHLTALDGVDVPVASAFLQFMHPEDYVVVDARSWAVLREAGELDGSYPDPLTAADYERYLATCRTVPDRCKRSLWALYRTLWLLGEDSATDAEW